MINIIQISEQLLEKQFKRIAEPTQYIAGFRTKRGRELALERKRNVIYLWAENVIEFPDEFLLRPIRNYSKDKSRNSNLNNKNSSRLVFGRPVDYWQLETTEELQTFVEWYQQQ